MLQDSGSSPQTDHTKNLAKGPEADRVQSLFASIAHGYDQANTFMTFGLDKLWRKQVVAWSDLGPNQDILDVATGTGDLAIEFAEQGGSVRVTGVDFCDEMLALAPQKAKAKDLEIEFRWGDAQALPFKDASFDIVSIAYGIRNVNEPQIAIREMARILKPGGRLMILETGRHQVRAIQGVFDFYFKRVVPRIGGWVTGKKEAYDYLNRTSKAFPCREEFLQLLNESFPFARTEYRTLLGGASYLYKATC